MAVVTDMAKDLIERTDSALAAVDLTDYQNCVIVNSADSGGRRQVTSPSGQGVDWAGVLINTSDDPATSGANAEFATVGVVKIKANAAFNNGIKLAIADTAGTVAAAASGDYVVGVSREAATGAGHLVSVELTSPGQQLN
jgi:hypothetical protein